MTLQETTELALTAICAEDLDRLTAALRDRSEAIDAGAVATPEIVKAGDDMIVALTVLKQKLAFQSALLEQVRIGYLG